MLTRINVYEGVILKEFFLAYLKKFSLPPTGTNAKEFVRVEKTPTLIQMVSTMVLDH